MPLLSNHLQVFHECRPKSVHLNLLSKALCSKAHPPIPTVTLQSSLSLPLPMPLFLLSGSTPQQLPACSMASFRLGPFLPRASAAYGFFSSLPHLYTVIYLLIVSSQEAVDL